MVQRRGTRRRAAAAAVCLPRPRIPSPYVLVPACRPRADDARRSAAARLRAPGGIMTAVAATVQMFFTERLISERGASPATITAYRDTIRLLLNHAAAATGTPVAALDFTQLDAPMISGFLQHLETGRGNSIRTRNA